MTALTDPWFDLITHLSYFVKHKLDATSLSIKLTQRDASTLNLINLYLLKFMLDYSIVYTQPYE